MASKKMARQTLLSFLALTALLSGVAHCGGGSGGAADKNKVGGDGGGGGGHKPVWGYVGSSGAEPKKWGGICGAGQRQSPVDLVDPEFDPDIPGIRFEDYGEEPYEVKITNNGHSLKATFRVSQKV